MGSAFVTLMSMTKIPIRSNWRDRSCLSLSSWFLGISVHHGRGVGAVLISGNVYGGSSHTMNQDAGRDREGGIQTVAFPGDLYPGAKSTSLLKQCPPTVNKDLRCELVGHPRFKL